MDKEEDNSQPFNETKYNNITNRLGHNEPNLWVNDSQTNGMIEYYIKSLFPLKIKVFQEKEFF